VLKILNVCVWMVQMKGVRAKDERLLKSVSVNAEAGFPLTTSRMNVLRKTVRRGR